MVSNDDFDGKATHLNCFYLHINFEQKYPKPAIVVRGLCLRKYSNTTERHHQTIGRDIRMKKNLDQGVAIGHRALPS